MAALNIHGFVLLIQDIALSGLQLAQVIFAGDQLVINPDVAVLICHIFTHRIFTSVVQDELDAVDTFSGIRIDLMDHDGGHTLIGDLQGSRLAILHTDISGGVVQLVSVGSFELCYLIPAAFRLGQRDDAIAVRCIGTNDLTVHLPHFKLYTRNAGAGVFIGLDDLKTAGWCVVEGQSLCVVWPYHNGLAASRLIDDVAVRGLHLRYDKRASNAADRDLAVLIRGV